MNATAERVSSITVPTMLALAALIASTSAWAGGVVSTCDETHLNTALSGGGTVAFSCGPATITVTSTKTISASTTIDGGGMITISGGASVQVFIVNPSATFTVQNLTITNGKAVGYAGGITNNGTTIVTNSTFSGNTGQDGGGIYSGNNLTVTGSTFSGNSAQFVGGGGIYNDGDMTVTNSTFNGNTAVSGANGGAILNYFHAQITGSAFSGNTAAGGGGAIYDETAASTGPVNDNCFVGNTATSGSGVFSSLAVLNAINNWWGAASGPSGVGPGTGDAVSSNVTFAPFLTSAPSACSAAPSTVTLITPQTGAVIAQNHHLAFCPSDPTRGKGYQATFRWAYTKPPGFNHFHLHVQRVGAATAALDRDLSKNNFWFLACNRVVVDSELGNWFWQVTAVDNFGAILGTSEQRPFSFAPCRLSNGAACAP